MKSDDIKGYIEIKGKKYSTISLLHALYKQKIPVQLNNGCLKLGKITLKPVSNEDDIDGYCRLSSICKLRDQIHENKENFDLSDIDIDEMVKIVDESNTENTYYNECELDFDENKFQISDFSNQSDMNGALDDYMETDYEPNYKEPKKPKKMVGVNPLTRTGPEVNRIPVESLPDHLKTQCPYCKTIVSKTWKYCPEDGYIIK